MPSITQSALLPDYPFAINKLSLSSGHQLAYIDEGPRDAPVVLMLHGNPSWSYYWRHLVLALRDHYRCIVPDHIGMGNSDKPKDDAYDYTLQSRVDDLRELTDHLQLPNKITLAVHDWGGMIGFGWALAHPERIQRLIITNTAAFPLPEAKPLPWQLKLCRNTRLGAFLVRRFNAFALGAALFGTKRKLSPAVRRAYTAPYDNHHNRISTLRFIQDIPLSAQDKAWSLVAQSAATLANYADRPTIIGWGMNDFVFDHHFLKGFTDCLPSAEVHRYDDAGHYVMEDKHETLVPHIVDFMQRTDA